MQSTEISNVIFLLYYGSPTLNMFFIIFFATNITDLRSYNYYGYPVLQILRVSDPKRRLSFTILSTILRFATNINGSITLNYIVYFVFYKYHRVYDPRNFISILTYKFNGFPILLVYILYSKNSKTYSSL